MACRPGLSFRALLFRRGERAGFCCLVKAPFVISSARAIGRCDTAFRWACDALFEFGRKLLLNAPPCRMLDMCAHVCDLQAGHSQREKICRSHHRGGDRPALSSPCFAQIGAVRAKVCVHSRRSCVGPRSKWLGRCLGNARSGFVCSRRRLSSFVHFLNLLANVC